MLLSRHRRLRLAAGLLQTVNLLYLRLALKRPAASRSFAGLIFRQYMTLVRQDQWLCRPIHEIVDIPDGTRLTLEYCHSGGVGAPVDELAYLAILTQVCRPRSIFEIGTFRGRTALNFALNAPDDCTVWTLDLPPAERPQVLGQVFHSDAAIIQRSQTGADYQGKPGAHKIKQLYGNSLAFDFAPYAGQMDMVFVDGAHHYAAARSDTANALRMIKPNGLILWHDFANYGEYNDVTRAVLDAVPGQQVIQIAGTELAVYRRPAD